MIGISFGFILKQITRALRHLREPTFIVLTTRDFSDGTKSDITDCFATLKLKTFYSYNTEVRPIEAYPPLTRLLVILRFWTDFSESIAAEPLDSNSPISTFKLKSSTSTSLPWQIQRGECTSPEKRRRLSGSELAAVAVKFCAVIGPKTGGK